MEKYRTNKMTAKIKHWSLAANNQTMAHIYRLKNIKS